MDVHPYALKLASMGFSMRRYTHYPYSRKEGVLELEFAGDRVHKLHDMPMPPIQPAYWRLLHGDYADFRPGVTAVLILTADTDKLPDEHLMFAAQMYASFRNYIDHIAPQPQPPTQHG